MSALSKAEFSFFHPSTSSASCECVFLKHVSPSRQGCLWNRDAFRLQSSKWINLCKVCATMECFHPYPAKISPFWRLSRNSNWWSFPLPCGCPNVVALCWRDSVTLRILLKLFEAFVDNWFQARNEKGVISGALTAMRRSFTMLCRGELDRLGCHGASCLF